ncbi:carboxylating nicotinate-nucleotide diphosphorylase [Kineosporia sp. NBRC 101731]|uniref:carboxylating nicotinate-nucleotide diphosphorylase n=1 Tax=Kineosporia sp. NBRC 101731 TaxID=3032199 RepID=UPI0024A2AA02|nr:carboxylating nicotinate-nucleotide diphosphorylase [Kineosporia sp. NBRC 101731]GLY27559.1 putative nicotinate-nucleotide pyrophosphatase NadC [Kineosporia sp. NBRC 101731]
MSNWESLWPAGVSERLDDAGLDPARVRSVVRDALAEDLGIGGAVVSVPGAAPGHDVTSESTIGADVLGQAHVVARTGGVISGMPLIPVVLAEVAGWTGLAGVSAEVLRADGDVVVRDDVLAVLRGPVQVLLIAERTLLNLVCRTSGISTHTRLWAQELSGTGAQVLDTRKTTPGLRMLEKYAVRCGGGTNKRMGLYDVAMVKDNHKIAAGSVAGAYRAVRERFPAVAVQVEVTTPDEAVEAVLAGARFLLCDNMSPAVLAESVKVARAATDERIEIEATGGLTVEVANEYARTGVDYLSVGGLTHSSPILDLAIDLISD